MRLLLFFSILASLSLANAAFLVSEGNVGEKISILCENQESVYVSPPSGAQVRYDLDSDFQAFFVPDAPGPYAVQCGNETKIITVLAAASADGAGEGAAQQRDYLVLYAVVVLFAVFAAAAALIAKVMIFERTLFAKSVENGMARLHLRAGKRMEDVSIDDPVSMGFAGKAVQLSIPLLLAGAEWSYEYEIGQPERALPASLKARMNGQEISILSELYIGREKKEVTNKTAEGSFAAKRKLPKASKD